VYRIRWSSVILVSTFVVLLAVLLVLRDALLQAHVDKTINKFASDASVYFEAYQTLYANADLTESPVLFLRGSPILFMKLSGGNLFLIESCNLALMFFSLRVAMRSLGTLNGRLLFLACALVFPYFLFGFLGLNKEIYAMCSAIFFGSYLIRGRRSHLVLALTIGAFARYYMLAALLLLLFTVPRERPPRYKAIVAVLLTLSFAAPIAKQFIPEYSSENLIAADSGTISIIFATLIDHYGYAAVYPFKYLILMPIRAYSFIVVATEDAMGGVVSVWSMLMFFWACKVMMDRKALSPLVKRLIVAGFAAPIPIMWSEIMHWRYYSFVYFFFLYAVVLHVEGQRSLTRQRRALAAPA